MNGGASSPEQFQLPAHKIPILVQLGLTFRCNLKCPHCYALYRRDLDEFTTEEALALVDALYDLGSGAVVYSHGENLIRKDFHRIARHIHDLGMYQTLMTNGYYLQSEQDVQRLCDTGIDRVLVSIDSSDPATHDRTRGREGAFGVATSALVRLKKAGISTVGFSTTIDTHNYDHIDEIIRLALDLGMDAISFMQNRYNRPGIFDRTLWVKYVAVCREIYEKILTYRGVIDLYTHDPFMLTVLDDRLDDEEARAAFIGSNICNVGTSMISIDPVGNVTGCNFIEKVIGNTRDEPVAAIWERLTRTYSDEEDPPGGPCQSCASRPQCMGGCKAFHYTGKFDERCGERHFGAHADHGLEAMPLPAYPAAPQSRKAGEFARGRLRVLG